MMRYAKKRKRRQTNTEDDISLRSDTSSTYRRAHFRPIVETEREQESSLASGDSEKARGLTLKESILFADHDRLLELLNLGHPVGDGLYFAISVNSIAGVELICWYYKTYKGDIATHALVSNHPIGSDFLPVLTPLWFAAENNYFDIIQILVRYGAVMPDLNPFIKLTSVLEDDLVQGLIRTHWLRAATSPALILTTESNPIGKVFRLAIDIKHSSSDQFPSFENERKTLNQKLENLLCELLDQARSKVEVTEMLALGAYQKISDSIDFKKNMSQPDDGSLPKGIRKGVSLEFKKLVAHPYSQMIVEDKLYNGPINWKKLSALEFFLLSLLIFIGSPILNIIIAVLPVGRLVNLMKTPYVRLLNNISAYTLFLVIILVFMLQGYSVTVCPSNFADFPQYFIRHPDSICCAVAVTEIWSLQGRLFVLLGVVLGYTIWLGSNLYRMGLQTFSRRARNWLDFTQTMAFWISLITHLITYMQLKQTSYESIVMETSNTTSAIQCFPDMAAGERRPFNSIMVAETSLAIGCIVAIFRLLFLSMYFRFTGPLVVSLINMSKVVVPFLVILLVIFLSFDVGLMQLLNSYSVWSASETINPDSSSVKEWGSSMYAMLRSVILDSTLDNIDLSPSLSLLETTAKAILIVFIFITLGVMLNMLIAIMSEMHRNFEPDAMTEWRYNRTLLLEDYIGNRADVPPPFNIIPSVRQIFIVIGKLFRSCQDGCLRMSYGNDLPDAKRMSSTERLSKAPEVRERKKIIKALVQRYIQANFNDIWKQGRKTGGNKGSMHTLMRKGSTRRRFMNSDLSLDSSSRFEPIRTNGLQKLIERDVTEPTEQEMEVLRNLLVEVDSNHIYAVPGVVASVPESQVPNNLISGASLLDEKVEIENLMDAAPPEVPERTGPVAVPISSPAAFTENPTADDMELIDQEKEIISPTADDLELIDQEERIIRREDIAASRHSISYV